MTIPLRLYMLIAHTIQRILMQNVTPIHRIHDSNVRCEQLNYELDSLIIFFFLDRMHSMQTVRNMSCKPQCIVAEVQIYHDKRNQYLYIYSYLQYSYLQMFHLIRNKNKFCSFNYPINNSLNQFVGPHTI